MTKKIRYGRKSAERLARRWFRQAGVKPHYVGFSEDDCYYLIIHCIGRGEQHEFGVPCWGAHALRLTVNDALRAMTTPSLPPVQEVLL